MAVMSLSTVYCGDLCIKKWFKPPWHVIWQNWTRFNWLNGVISLALSLYLRTQGLRQPTANARIFREIKSPGQKNSRQNIAERKILGSENSRNSFFPKNLKKKLRKFQDFSLARADYGTKRRQNPSFHGPSFNSSSTFDCTAHSTTSTYFHQKN